VSAPGDLVELSRLLLACRRFVKAERDLVLESNCVPDARGRPRRETLEKTAKGFVRSAERLLGRIDAQLQKLAG